MTNRLHPPIVVLAIISLLLCLFGAHALQHLSTEVMPAVSHAEQLAGSVVAGTPANLGCDDCCAADCLLMGVACVLGMLVVIIAAVIRRPARVTSPPPSGRPRRTPSFRHSVARAAPSLEFLSISRT